MKKIAMIAMLSVFLWTNTGAAQENTVSIFAMDLAPYFWQDDQGNWQGLYAELAIALVEQAGFQPEFQDLSWKRGLDYLKTGEIELTALLSKTPEREEFFHFLGVSAFEQTVLLVREENAAQFQSIQTLDDLTRDDWVWGIREEAFYSDEFNHRLETDEAFRAHFDIIVQIRLNVEKVDKGRTSGAFVDRIGMSYALKTEEDWNDLTMLAVPFFPPADIYFAVSKQIAPEKLEKLQAAYESLDAQGVFDDIVAKWVE